MKTVSHTLTFEDRAQFLNRVELAMALPDVVGILEEESPGRLSYLRGGRGPRIVVELDEGSATISGPPSNVKRLLNKLQRPAKVMSALELYNEGVRRVGQAQVKSQYLLAMVYFRSCYRLGAYQMQAVYAGAQCARLGGREPDWTVPEELKSRMDEVWTVGYASNLVGCLKLYKCQASLRRAGPVCEVGVIVDGVHYDFLVLIRQKKSESRVVAHRPEGAGHDWVDLVWLYDESLRHGVDLAKMGRAYLPNIKPFLETDVYLASILGRSTLALYALEAERFAEVIEGGMPVERLYNAGEFYYRNNRDVDAGVYFRLCRESDAYGMQAAYANYLCGQRMQLSIPEDLLFPEEFRGRDGEVSAAFYAGNMACYLIGQGHQARVVKGGDCSEVVATINGQQYVIAFRPQPGEAGMVECIGSRVEGGERVGLRALGWDVASETDHYVLDLTTGFASLPLSPLPEGGLEVSFDESGGSL